MKGQMTGQQQNRRRSSGSSVYTNALDGQMRVLVAVQEHKKELDDGAEEWTDLIVRMAVRTVVKRPRLWTAALNLCVALDGFWNTKFADTASKASIAVKETKNITEEKVKKQVKGELKTKQGWLGVTLGKIPNARELHNAYSDMEHEDQANAIYDIRTDMEKRPVPDYLQYFVRTMRDIENFGNEFRVNYNTYMGPIVARLGAKKSDIGILLDLQTEGGYGDFGKKAWAEVSFLSGNMQALDEAKGAVLNSTADLANLDGKRKAGMSELTGHGAWTGGMPPNTPTLVAMQRLLMRVT